MIERARRPGTDLWLLVGLVLMIPGLSAGCRRPHVEGTVATDTILKAWRSAGFDTQSVRNVEPDAWSAGACSRGLVSGLDVLICEYASDEAAGVGDQKINADWEQEGISTALLARTSKTVLAISDRGKADRSGKTINRLAKLFRDQR